MLRNIRIKNFLSFRQESLLNFEKSNYKLLDKRNTIDKITKGSFFIGANASGKTNAIKSIRVLLDLLFGKDDFMLDNFVCYFSDSDIIEVAYEFVIDGEIIKYEITRDVANKLFTEKLFVDDKELLDRIGSNARYYGGPEFSNEIYTDIDQNTLFIREIFFNTKFRGNKALQKWFVFLKNSIYINPSFKTINNFAGTKLTIDDFLEDNGVDEINIALKELMNGLEVEFTKLCKGEKVTYLQDNDSVFIRRNRTNQPFPIEMESEGTNNLLNVLPSFLHVVKNNGMLIIDEFSSAFHNFLERILVKYFYKYSQHSQLFLVTHATNLLSSEIIRPDQVFTFNFSDDNGSKVIKVSEYAQPRASQNFEKMYLSGMFEGIPDYE